MICRKLSIHYGVTATKITSEKARKEKEHKTYEYDKITDVRLINFCVEHCPHDKCNGNQCKELADFSKSLRGVTDYE